MVVDVQRGAAGSGFLDKGGEGVVVRVVTDVAARADVSNAAHVLSVNALCSWGSQVVCGCLFVVRLFAANTVPAATQHGQHGSSHNGDNPKQGKWESARQQRSKKPNAALAILNPRVLLPGVAVALLGCCWARYSCVGHVGWYRGWHT